MLSRYYTDVKKQQEFKELLKQNSHWQRVPLQKELFQFVHNW